MEIVVFIFAAMLVAIGLLLILHVKGALWAQPPADPLRDQQWSAYEERRMRVRRDRVWWKIETLYSEFAEREAAAAAREPATAPRPEQGGDRSTLTSRRPGAADGKPAAPSAAAAHHPQRRN